MKTPLLYLTIEERLCAYAIDDFYLFFFVSKIYSMYLELNWKFGDDKTNFRCSFCR